MSTTKKARYFLLDDGRETYIYKAKDKKQVQKCTVSYRSFSDFVITEITKEQAHEEVNTCSADTIIDLTSYSEEELAEFEKSAKQTKLKGILA